MKAFIVVAGLLIGFQQSAAIAGEIVCSAPGTLLECTLPDNVKMNFRLIEPDPDDDLESYYIGTTEITQRQWAAVMEETPWAGRGNVGPEDHGMYPATYISWTDLSIKPPVNPDDCDPDNPTDLDCNFASFPGKWNTMGSGYETRLPTQIEWEYACRGGRTTDWGFDDTEEDLGSYAWYRTNTWDEGIDHPMPVKLKDPTPVTIEDPIGYLYDMHGNVWEWVDDWHDPNTKDNKMERGGSFGSLAPQTTCDAIGGHPPKLDWAYTLEPVWS